MKIVIATDSFKGSLTAREAVAAIARGANAALPGVEIVGVPLGDGGEGTVDALVAAVPGSRIVTRKVSGPLGSCVDASYGILGPAGTTAVVEMAAASGITLVDKSRLDPMRATTYGTGELIADALRQPGVSELIVGIGGSATNDGGAGALQALGVRFISATACHMTAKLAAEDLRGVTALLAPPAKHSAYLHVTVACDVTNPLVGPRGASAVFGPQKGATSDMVAVLDRLLHHLSPLLDDLHRQRGGQPADRPVKDRAGAGAAGGLGAGLMALFPDAVFKPGIDVVLDAVGFDDLLRDADLIVTGEGKLDAQTLSGKAIDGVLRRARKAGVPAIAFAGVVDPDASTALEPAGLSGAYAILPRASSPADAMARAAEYLEALAAEQFSRLFG